MVVAKVVDARTDGQGAGDGRQRDKSRMPGERLEPAVDWHRLGNRLAETAAVNDREHCRQHHQFSGTAQQDASSGNQTQFSHTDKAGQGS